MNNNVIVMTEAGKPIFSRYGSQGDVARICGLVQAIRIAVNRKNSALGLGEIQSIHSKKMFTVFMTAGSITLMHVSETTGNTIETEAFARLQLEYIYAHLIFMLTANVQKTFLRNPGFDLRSMISSNESLLRGILDENGPEGNIGPFLVSSVKSCFPISYKIRQQASKSLQTIAREIQNNIAFALLVVGDKLLTVIQPSFRPHRLRVSDLHLILNFVGKQNGLTSSELWLPMCLPRFHSTGYLYAYTNCFDIESKLSIILLSSLNTTDQFQILRAAAQKVREQLNLPTVSDSLLIVKDDHGLASSPTNTADVDWKRGSESFDNCSTTDDGFVNVSFAMLESENSIPEEGELLRQVRLSSQLSSIEHICKQYLDHEDSHGLVHFLFRLDVPVESSSSRKKQHQQQPGFLSQCIVPPARAPFNTTVSHQRIWSNYQKLSLRLRLGSATVEASMDAFDMIRNHSSASGNNKHESASFNGIGNDCPSVGLHESAPYNSDGLSYIVEGDEIYLAINGKHFEL
eukprot:jgi/Psemu1/20173/gm1.20173_g